MKSFLLSLFALMLAFCGFSQSSYTTTSTTTTAGYPGIDSCTHEWFLTTVESDDTAHIGNILEVKTQTVSRQCVRCGKQISTETKWTTYQLDTTSSFISPIQYDSSGYFMCISMKNKETK